MGIVTAEMEAMELLGHEVNAVSGEEKAQKAHLVNLAEMGRQVSLVTMVEMGPKADKALLETEGTPDLMAHKG